LYIKLNIKHLIKPEKSKNDRKADFETSRLFYEQFWNVLPIENGTTLLSKRNCFGSRTAWLCPFIKIFAI
jgi:hypothetical protein